MRRPLRYFPPDGVLHRTRDDERELNAAFGRLATHPDWPKVQDYLRSITILNIQGPGASDAELRHVEGQRFLLGIIERRIDHGRNRKPDADAYANAAEPQSAGA